MLTRDTPRTRVSARLPVAAHTGQPWRIHEIAPDFTVEDVWTLPTPGGPHELPRLLRAVRAELDEPTLPAAARALVAARQRLGTLLRLDRPDAGLGSRVPSLRERLPSDLRAATPSAGAAEFTPLYEIEDEWAAEIANSTVHAVMHLGWVPDGAGGYRGQMTVLVKPNGRLGAAYMALILPFRYLVVYPALLRAIGRRWGASA